MGQVALEHELEVLCKERIEDAIRDGDLSDDSCPMLLEDIMAHLDTMTDKTFWKVLAEIDLKNEE